MHTNPLRFMRGQFDRTPEQLVCSTLQLDHVASPQPDSKSIGNGIGGMITTSKSTGAAPAHFRAPSCVHRSVGKAVRSYLVDITGGGADGLTSSSVFSLSQ